MRRPALWPLVTARPAASPVVAAAGNVPYIGVRKGTPIATGGPAAGIKKPWASE